MIELIDVVRSVNWNENCTSAVDDTEIYTIGEKSLVKLSNWCRQIENVYNNNPSLPFIREAQVSAQDFFCLVSLGLYKSSASSLRTILESFLYFSYFKDHPVELNSLINVAKYYISKADILAYHNLHTPDFTDRSRRVGLTSRLEKSYAKISAIVHGQMPGVWHSSPSLANKRYDKDLVKEAINEFVEVVGIVNLMMLMLISDEDWNNIDQKVKAILINGVDSKFINLLDRN
ncbi:hypothetical protein WD376_004259 [Vibrio vulnificus]|nr:hypothetical protein [Vibrio vulnificus]